MKTRTWILIFAVLLCVCGAAVLYLNAMQSGETADIYSQGELYATVDLGRDATLVVTVGSSSNTIVIQDGEIFVSEADCPDQICVNHGPAKAGSPVVCLPNELVISVKAEDAEEDALDAVTGG